MRLKLCLLLLGKINKQEIIQLAIESIEICEWNGATVRTSTINAPSWDEISEALLAMNGMNLNDIYLHPKKSDPETYLAVGGGAGRYLVTGSINNEHFPTLVCGSSKSDVSLVVGGQEGIYPSNAVVNLEAAISAVKAFYEKGDFDCGINWGEI